MFRLLNIDLRFLFNKFERELDSDFLFSIGYHPDVNDSDNSISGSIITDKNHEEYIKAFRIACIGALYVSPLANKYSVETEHAKRWHIILKGDEQNYKLVKCHIVITNENNNELTKIVLSPEDTTTLLRIMSDDYLSRNKNKDLFQIYEKKHPSYRLK